MQNCESHDSVHSAKLISCGTQRFFGVGAECHRPSGRPDYHIIYISEGWCLVGDGNGFTKADAGSVIVFPPGVPQFYRYPDGDKTVSYFMHFKGSLADQLFLNGDVTKKRVFHIGVSASLEELFIKMTDEYKMKLPYFAEVCQGYLETILSVIMRKLAFSKSDGSSAVSQKIAEVCRYMHSVTNDEITIGELASMCHLSESRFSHLFKQIIGKSPLSYLLEIKINKAKELLENTEFTVCRISEMTGFSNQFYFSRLFKKYTSISPANYRRMTRELT